MKKTPKVKPIKPNRTVQNNRYKKLGNTMKKTKK